MNLGLDGPNRAAKGDQTPLGPGVRGEKAGAHALGQENAIRGKKPFPIEAFSQRAGRSRFGPPP